MKRLAGKTCGCGSRDLAVAGEGQVLVVRCLNCTNHSILCPEPGCHGKMRDTHKSGYKEQRCLVCGYETEYKPLDAKRQEELFA
jgi:hypothetical protein